MMKNRSVDSSREELQEQLASEQPPKLLDCREADEWDICKIAGAELIPLSQFPDLPLARLGADKARHIVVHCHHGCAVCGPRSGFGSRAIHRLRAYAAASTCGPTVPTQVCGNTKQGVTPAVTHPH